MDPQHSPSTVNQIIRENQYELNTDIGKITIETIVLPHYVWIIFTNASQLAVNGSLQLAMQTPFNDKPTVIDIAADENQADGDQFCMKLSKELSSVVVLSYNLEARFTVKDQTAILKFLKGQIQSSRKNQEMNNLNN